MAKPGKTGVRRVIDATGYAFKGIKAAFDTEAAFRQEAVALAILLPLALLSNTTGTEKALLIGSILLVLVIELLNTAVEALADEISGKKRPLLGKAKDCGSAAVFLSIINAAVIWLLIIFF